MDNQTLNKELEKYLSTVDRYLKYMPVTEKTDILSELKSGFLEMMADGKTAEQIIETMGSPKELAANYLGESIVKSKKFSWRRFLAAIGFYSAASASWLVVIPTLASLAASFFFASGVSIFAGVLGCLKGFITPFAEMSLVKDMHFVVFSSELTGVPALLAGLILAVVFFAIGVLCWKGTVMTVRKIQEQRWKLKYEV